LPTVALCSICAMDRSLPDAASLAARCGADGIEVTARAPHLESGASLDEVRAAGDRVRGAGIEVTAYGSYLSYLGPDFAKQAAAEVERAAALGTELLRVWAGHPEGAGDGVRDDVVAMLRAAGDAAAREGIVVVIERHGGTLADTADRTEALLDAVDHAHVSLNYQTLDGLPAAEASAQPDDARRLIPRSRYFHVKNYRENPLPRGPLVLGGDLEKGVLDYRAILGAAVEAGYRGPYAIEFVAFDSRPLEGKVADGIAWLRRTLEEVGAP
jgi:sugar phosphate isomerase/epimerase